MFIATLSLLTSIYNGYLNGRFVDLVQHNVARVEYMKTCKEIIDSYFQVKLKARIIAASVSAGGQRDTPVEEAEAQGAVARFSALGTYLANLRDERMRHEFTELARLLERLVADAPRQTRAEMEKRLEPADKAFTGLNDDCVRSANARPM